MNRKWYPASNQPLTFLLGSLFFGVATFMIGALLFGTTRLKINGRVIDNATMEDKLPMVAFLLIFLVVGAGVAVSSFSGYWIDDEGITSRSFFRVKTLRWTEITDIGRQGGRIELIGSSDRIRVYRNYKWDFLRSAIEEHLPKKQSSEPKADRPTNKYAGNPTGVYLSRGRKTVPAIVGVCALMFVVMFVTVSRYSFRLELVPMIVLQLAFMGAVAHIGSRAKLEIQQDSFTYTPSIGKTVRMAYSQIRSLRYETRTTDKGQIYSVWVVESTDGVKSSISGIEELDRAAADLASRMPEHAIYSGPGVLD